VEDLSTSSAGENPSIEKRDTMRDGLRDCGYFTVEKRNLINCGTEVEASSRREAAEQRVNCRVKKHE
jgi:hypothetical protein